MAISTRKPKPNKNWVEDFTAEVVADFCKAYGVDSLEKAITERNRTLWKARFRKQLHTAIDKRLDREIAEAIKEII